MLENLFYKSFLNIQYKLGNKIKTTTFVDTYATRFGFINEKFVKIIHKKLETQSQRLIKPKQIQRFDNRAIIIDSTQ